MMGRATIQRSPHDDANPYVLIRKATVEDNNLSWEARGVLAYVLSKPNDWKVQVDDLTRQGPGGRDRMYRIIKELRDAGYLRYTEERDERGHITETQYFVSEHPLPEKPDTANPETDKPDTAKPDTAEPDTEKPDSTNKGIPLSNEKELSIEGEADADAPPVAAPQPKRQPSPRNKPEPKAETPKLSDHPAIKVYHDLHRAYPTSAQMQIITQHDPPLENWIRAVNTWAARGYNRLNIEGMLEWAMNPAKMERNGGAPPTTMGGYAPNNKVANNQNEVRKAFDRLRAQESPR